MNATQHAFSVLLHKWQPLLVWKIQIKVYVNCTRRRWKVTQNTRKMRPAFVCLPTVNNVDKKCPWIPRPTFEFRQILLVALLLTVKATSVSILPGFESHPLFPVGGAWGGSVVCLTWHFGLANRSSEAPLAAVPPLHQTNVCSRFQVGEYY